jgi:TonB family protein
MKGRRAIPEYPARLRERCVEGDVEVLVFIDAEGKVRTVKVVNESPHLDFNESAVRAAYQQQWIPADRDGVRIPSMSKYSYHFRIDPEGQGRCRD